jgi:hypothetical protein
MNARHILVGSMLCLLFVFVYCDTMDDVKKMEGETNNLTLIAVSGGGGVITKTCYPGAFPLSLGGSRSITVTSSNQIDNFVITVPDPVPSTGDINIHTSGTAGLIGYLYNSNCDSVTQNGDWSGDFTIVSHITQPGKYWVQVWADAAGYSYTIFASIP